MPVTDVGVRQSHVWEKVLRRPVPTFDYVVWRPLSGELPVWNVRNAAEVRAVLSLVLLTETAEVLRALSGWLLPALEDKRVRPLR